MEIIDIHKKRRYPGVYSFATEQENIFFGRDNDISKLLTQIEVEKQVLLYSKSGIGKTSLINAGIIPRLPQNFETIKIRFFAYNKTISPTERIINVLKDKYPNIYNQEHKIIDKLIEHKNIKKTLWYYIKKLQLYPTDKIFLFIFDQFEELFSYPDEEQKQFKNQYHELISPRVPDIFSNLIEEKLDTQPDFFDTKSFKNIHEPLDFKTVFVIRSDKLSLLNRLSDKIPNIQKEFYELKPLTKNQAEKAIVMPALDKSETFETKSFTFEKNALDKIIEQLTITKNTENEIVTQPIETTQLQIVCQRIEKNIANKKSENFENSLIIVTENDIPDFKDIFLDFYNSAIASLPEKEQQELARKLIENELIRNNQRISLDGRICTDFIMQSSLQKLVDTHLLKPEPNTTGGYNYELAHDTLVEPILELQKIRKEKEIQARLEAERKEEQRKAKEKEELLKKSEELLKLLVEGKMTANTLWEHFEFEAKNELVFCQFEAARKFYNFARLSPDLPNQQTIEIQKFAAQMDILVDCNNKALEHFRHFRYHAAENEYRKILAFLPNDEIIQRRIFYCQNPVFSLNNFVLIKGGSFMQGSKKPEPTKNIEFDLLYDEGALSNETPHKVILSDYKINKYQVTNEEYAEFITIFGSDKVKEGKYKDEPLIDNEWFGLQKKGKLWIFENNYEKHPVVRISWFGATEFCKFWNVQLPSEAQWEFAARSGGKLYKYSWGNEEPKGVEPLGKNEKGEDVRKYGNIADECLHRTLPHFTDIVNGYDDGFAVTSPVGSFEANELGLYDMSGNVWEWCQDIYNTKYYQECNNKGIVTNPICEENGLFRVSRGGSWRYNTAVCRVAFRGSDALGYRNGVLGFRLAINLSDNETR